MTRRPAGPKIHSFLQHAHDKTLRARLLRKSEDKVAHGNAQLVLETLACRRTFDDTKKSTSLILSQLNFRDVEPEHFMRGSPCMLLIVGRPPSVPTTKVTSGLNLITVPPISVFISVVLVTVTWLPILLVMF